jgi:hypothetical protein
MAQHIEFTARMEKGSVVWEGPGGRPAKSHRLDVPKGAPPQAIEFGINDETGLGLRFDDATPFQVWEQQGCPPAGIDTDQVEVVHSGSDKVRIVNQNTGPARTLQYQLNVVSKDGKSWPCDPIIDNGGGNSA